jgi:hypothetical protein
MGHTVSRVLTGSQPDEVNECYAPDMIPWILAMNMHELMDCIFIPIDRVLR